MARPTACAYARGVKIDAGMMTTNPRDAIALAERLEGINFDGAYTFEGAHDPFLPLAMAATSTQRLELFTSIAVGFARNPMTLANTAWDLQLASEGRFILGLGSQIRPHIQKRYSMPWSRPAARMREMIQAMRAIFDCWENDVPLNFEGEFYTHTLMTPIFSPGPHPHGLPPIYLAAFGPRMTEVAGEVADGFMAHPVSTPDSLRANSLPALHRGIETAGRTPGDVTVSVQVIVCMGDTDEELDTARLRARGQLAFYCSTPAYRPTLDVHGWGDLQPELNAMSKRGEWGPMTELITDEILETITVVGTPEHAAGELQRRYGSLADRICPSDYGSNLDHQARLVAAFKGA